MFWLATVGGTLLVLTALRDVFHTLWHPKGFGTVSHGVFRVVWGLARQVNRTRLSTELAGPWGILATVAVWTGLVVAGCALVYLPHMPDGFHFGSSLRPERSSDVVASLYLSVVAVATLGFGDIVPATAPLRLLVPVQALIGFVLLTAAISWILQVYPALNRRRALARRLEVLSETDTTGLVASGEPGSTCQVLDAVTDGVVGVDIDLMQFGETYYFREREPDVSLAPGLPYILRLVEAGRASGHLDVRAAAERLAWAAHRLATRLDGGYLHTGGTDAEVFAAFAEDHQQPSAFTGSG